MANSTAIPCMRYRDAAAAIDWLCATIGFERQLVVPGPDGTILHAQLTLGGGMIMLGSAVNKGTWYDRLMKQPDEIGGCQTQTTCLVVADADAIYKRALLAKAEILMPIKDEDYGGRSFSFRDPQGHAWTVGTYDPWKM